MLPLSFEHEKTESFDRLFPGIPERNNKSPHPVAYAGWGLLLEDLFKPLRGRLQASGFGLQEQEKEKPAADSIRAGFFLGGPF